MLAVQEVPRKVSRGSGNLFWNFQHKPGQCAAASTNFQVKDMSFSTYIITVADRAVIIVMLKVSYSCFARKIVSAVVNTYGPLSIVIIGLYLNSTNLSPASRFSS